MNPSPDSAPSALVAVLGDLGRSPRMLNHARQLLARGWSVTLAGLRETEIPADLASNPRVRVLAADLTVEAGRKPRARARWQLLRLLATQRPDWHLVLVQNPPAFPVLGVLAVARWRLRRTPRATVIVDWHNFGYTLLRAQGGRGRWSVALYRWLEFAFARSADAHWTVSSALAAHVATALGGVRVTVLRDAPPAALCAAAHVTEERFAWWRRTLPEFPPPPPGAPWLVMPSSWTIDEYTHLITDALRLIAAGEVTWPKGRQVTLIATGRGAERAAFANTFRVQSCVALRQAWLPASAYAELLGHADAGLCLHASASGLDLPLKLADFKAAGLPSIVYDYGPVLRELFDPLIHGSLVHDARELACALAALATQPPPRLTPPSETWETNWQAVEADITRWAKMARETSV